MNNSLRALGLLGLTCAVLWYAVGGFRTPAVAGSETVSPPLGHENLCVYLVYGSDAVTSANVLTLQEALERELAVVHETSDVNTLAVENRSPDCELFIQSGDIVKGGKQDRMIATDVLVPPGAGRVPLPAHCVEQGRWTNRGAENAHLFQKSTAFAAGKELKYANALGQQSAVWKNVSENQDKLRMNVAENVTENASPTSFQLTVEAPAVKAKVAEYEAALRAAGDRKNVLGVVFVVNGQVTGAEVYGSNALFRKAWPKLLNAAAVEAVAERTDKPAAQPPTPLTIERFLARGAEPEPTAAPAAPDELQLRLRTAAALRNGTLTTNGEVLRAEGEQALAQIEGRMEGGRGRRAEEQQRETRAERVLVSENVAGVQPAPQLPTVSALPPTPGATTQPNRPLPAGGVAGVTITGDTQARNRVQPQLASPANPNGNRLNSNRTENRSMLLVESRDPARQNAVIHRSYIKK